MTHANPSSTDSQDVRSAPGAERAASETDARRDDERGLRAMSFEEAVAHYRAKRANRR
jgi:hypothetical protein